MDTMIGHALAYAGQGVPVFPLRPGSKIPLPGSAGFKDATTDPEQITSWWTEHPDANIGVPTGVVFDVLDIDGLEGSNSIEEWADQNGGARTIPNPTVLTPSGGYHIYLQPNGNGNRAGMLPHVDYRGIGGYVVAPPSRTETGEYRWM